MDESTKWGGGEEASESQHSNLSSQKGYEPPAYVRIAHESKPGWAITSVRRMTYTIIAAIAILAVLGACIGVIVGVANNNASTGANNSTSTDANNDTSASTSAISTSTGTVVQTTPSATIVPTQTPTPKPTATPTPTYAHFGDGTYQLGKDIQPGTYRTRAGSFNCYYARLSGFGGTLDEIIANNNTSAPAVVTIAATDAGFTSEECGTWTQNLSQITQSQTTFGDGNYIVGTDITPGTYRNSGGGQNCYFARLSGFGNTTDDIIANDNVSTPTIVTIASTDQGFQSEGCGTWTQQ